MDRGEHPCDASLLGNWARWILGLWSFQLWSKFAPQFPGLCPCQVIPGGCCSPGVPSNHVRADRSLPQSRVGRGRASHRLLVGLEPWRECAPPSTPRARPPPLPLACRWMLCLLCRDVPGVWHSELCVLGGRCRYLRILLLSAVRILPLLVSPGERIQEGCLRRRTDLWACSQHWGHLLHAKANCPNADGRSLHRRLPPELLLPREVHLLGLRREPRRRGLLPWEGSRIFLRHHLPGHLRAPWTHRVRPVQRVLQGPRGACCLPGVAVVGGARP
mmetsp:Transcript_17676/g.53378  ORF Transcript_17676/g.53378 Transcript_17676/m.53378 type:complete len:274 (+) Transcript_17676:283-1104(+)